MSAPSSSALTPCPWCLKSTPEGEDSCAHCGKGITALSHGALISGRYEILGLLGRGGMGAVYEAKDRELDETVAIKVMSTTAPAPDAEARFRSELKLARRVQHPNVCQVYDFGRHGRLLYIVMERLYGDSLKDRLNDARPIKDPAAIIEGIAQGLSAIHSAGLVHRDLKPSNIAVLSDGGVKVMDFGLAKELSGDSRLTTTGNVMGTPDYMSPEQARGERVDHRADIYAFGVVLCELFGGGRPFAGDTPVEVILNHLNSRPDLSRLPPAVAPIIERALAKPRNERYDSALEIAHALKGIGPASEWATMAVSATDRTRTAVALGGPASTPQEPTKRPIQWVFLGAVLVGGVAAIAGFVVTNTRAPSVVATPTPDLRQISGNVTPTPTPTPSIEVHVPRTTPTPAPSRGRDLKPVSAPADLADRVVAGARLFRTVMKGDFGLDKKVSPTGELRIVVLYTRDAGRATAIASAISQQNEPFKTLPTRVHTVPLETFLQTTPFASALFLAEPVKRDQLSELVHQAISRHIILFSPFDGDVEAGASSGISGTERAFLSMNSSTLSASGINLSDFLVRNSQKFP